ncbi:MAG: hypothetical protein ACW98X_24430 [Promethearchaeota archaeon]|jgi:hypothetical protein
MDTQKRFIDMNTIDRRNLYSEIEFKRHTNKQKLQRLSEIDERVMSDVKDKSSDVNNIIELMNSNKSMFKALERLFKPGPNATMQLVRVDKLSMYLSNVAKIQFKYSQIDSLLDDLIGEINLMSKKDIDVLLKSIDGLNNSAEKFFNLFIMNGVIGNKNINFFQNPATVDNQVINGLNRMDLSHALFVEKSNIFIKRRDMIGRGYNKIDREIPRKYM